MFSIPINLKLDENQFNGFLKFLKQHREHVYDLYFTCRMPPFVQDAMGDVFEDIGAPINSALYIQNELGIPVSATFNNTVIRPDQANLDLFIQNFEQLYAAGIRSATIPHTHWLATGQIQKAFPELMVKNTILRNVSHPNEVANLAKAGFNYINIDRDLMRDRDSLEKIRRAADKFNVKIALLGNEGCLGGCTMMDEHFQFNNTRGPGPTYFADPISRTSCLKWSVEDPATPLKTANIPPWREDWVELLDYVDVFKMHGRESITQFFSTLDIVQRYARGENILFNTFDTYINDTNLKDRPIDAWRKKIKNCKFDCWECNFCDLVYEAKSSVKANNYTLAVAKELVDSVNYDNNINVMGLTSPRVQNLLYGLSKHCNTYLEVGSAMGATAAAVAQNTNIKMHCVDKWEENIQPEIDVFMLPDNTKQQFDENVQHPNLTVHNSDLFAVDKSQIKNVDLFFYDGPHDAESTARAVEYYVDTFAETAILIFDDFNWEGVVAGANQGIERAGLRVVDQRVITNEVENPNQWWNGLYILVVQHETS